MTAAATESQRDIVRLPQLRRGVADVTHPTTDRFPCFDGLRAIAAMCVVIYHVAAATGVNDAHPLLGNYTSRLGGLGVAMFFGISGFLLYRPYAAAHFGGRAGPSTAGFYRRRVLRIVPAYWVALTVYAFVLRFQAIHGLKDAAAYYGLLQIYDRHRVLTGLAQAWSLGTEVSFYLVLPVLAFVAHRLIVRKRPGGGERLRAELLLLASLYLGAVAFRAWLAWVAPASAGFAITWIPARMDWFVVGMLLAVLSAWATERGEVPLVLGWAGAHPAVCWGLAGGVVVALSHLNLPRGFEPTTGGPMVSSFLLLGLFALLMVVPAVAGNQATGLIRRGLQSAPMRKLGLISYGVFLWHAVCIREIERLARTHSWARPLTFWHLLALVLPVTLAAATASYLLVERPALAFKDPGSGRAWLRRWKQRLVAPSPR